MISVNKLLFELDKIPFILFSIFFSSLSKCKLSSLSEDINTFSFFKKDSKKQSRNGKEYLIKLLIDKNISIIDIISFLFFCICLINIIGIILLYLFFL